MTTIAITLDDELAARLNEKAAKRGLAPEEWARQAVEEQLESSEGLDEEFESAVNHILEKNAELYRRLA